LKIEKKVIAIIQARIGSTRLPYKMMLSLHGKPIIEWVIKRVQKAKLLDNIIVAIPNTKENNILEKYIRGLGVDVFRGSEDNVLGRFYNSAKELKPTQIIRVCADNPLIDGEEIDNLIRFYRNNPCDYAYNHIPKDNLYPDGLGAEIISFELLEYLNSKVILKNHKEHCFSYITDNPDKFIIKTFNPIDKSLHYPKLKFDIDTFEDYYSLSMKDFNIDITSKELIKLFLDKNGELRVRILDIFNSFNPCANRIYRPYIIAEIGVNHEGSMEIAKRLVNEAKEGGADAVKFQSYKAETLASKDSPSYWDTTQEPTTSQYELFKKHDSFWIDEMRELKAYCDEVDIEFMSTPFDIESANFLDELMDVYKISSSDITNRPFIEYICEFNKPIILSTGASDLYEIQEAVSWIEKYGNPLALLHCVLNYPTPDINANLGMILDLKVKFPNKIIGYSDHTLPNDMKVCEMATMLGSVIVEKHFTHNKTLQGNDHYHAMDKKDLKLFRKNLDRAFEILGTFKVEALKDEKLARDNARRSLVAKRDIPKGKIMEKNDLTFKRPAFGISPKFIDEVIGKESLKDIEEDTVLQWNMFS